MIELCCEYLSVRCILLYVLVMSRTRFRVNPHSMFSVSEKNTHPPELIWLNSEDHIFLAVFTPQDF